MPVKRRVAKRRSTLPAAIDDLLAGRSIERTDENHEVLLGVAFFNDYPDLPPEAGRLALAALDAWPAKG